MENRKTGSFYYIHGRSKGRKIWYCMRIVVTKEHEAEGAFFKKVKNENFVFVSFSSLAPNDNAIQ